MLSGACRSFERAVERDVDDRRVEDRHDEAENGDAGDDERRTVEPAREALHPPWSLRHGAHVAGARPIRPEPRPRIWGDSGSTGPNNAQAIISPATTGSASQVHRLTLMPRS